MPNFLALYMGAEGAKPPTPADMAPDRMAEGMAAWGKWALLSDAALQRTGIDCCQSLPTLAFAVPANSEHILTSTYSYRLMRNFATRGYRDDLAAVTRPLTRSLPFRN